MNKVEIVGKYDANIKVQNVPKKFKSENADMEEKNADSASEMTCFCLNPAKSACRSQDRLLAGLIAKGSSCAIGFKVTTNQKIDLKGFRGVRAEDMP